MTRRETLALWTLLAVSALLRLLAPAAFPEAVADEGLWTNSSKNAVAFGDWFMDGRKHLFLSPVFHALAAGVFALAGPSLAAARAINGVAGAVSVFLLFALVRRTSGRVDHALAAAAFLGLTADFVFQARLALIEPLQLACVLASALALARPGAASPLLGGLAFAMALLTKLNSLWFAAVLPLFLLGGAPLRDRLRDPAWLTRVALFLAVALGVAGVVYAALFRWHPDLFVAAFRFELAGRQFVPLSPLVVRIGRFGVDPEMSARSVIALLRESPFLMVLATLGLAREALRRRRTSLAFGVWALLGSGFVLVQLYQPLRYFHAMAPAYCYFAAVALLAWRDEGGRDAKLPGLALAVIVAFNLAYLGMNAVANPGREVAAIAEWARTQTRPEERLIASGLYCTDPPNRCYAHYYLGDEMAQLAASIDRYEIDYVIWDTHEWKPALRDELALRYEKVHEWPFAQAFRVKR
jgi:4-amino-4-deoxy-L-arabinose transferase-like glycosyltransferase